MWAARQRTGLTLKEIRDALGGIDYAAVSIAIKRLEARAKQDRALAAMQKNIIDMLNVDSAEKPRGQIAAKPG